MQLSDITNNCRFERLSLSLPPSGAGGNVERRRSGRVMPSLSLALSFACASSLFSLRAYIRLFRRARSSSPGQKFWGAPITFSFRASMCVRAARISLCLFYRDPRSRAEGLGGRGERRKEQRSSLVFVLFFVFFCLRRLFFLPSFSRKITAILEARGGGVRAAAPRLRRDFFLFRGAGGREEVRRPFYVFGGEVYNDN